MLFQLYVLYFVKVSPIQLFIHFRISCALFKCIFCVLLSHPILRSKLNAHSMCAQEQVFTRTIQKCKYKIPNVLNT
jgi:hypothetical protein